MTDISNLSSMTYWYLLILLQVKQPKMDVQTGLVYVGIVVLSAAVIAFISMFGIREKSYEEAIAEQRKLPDDLLSSMSIRAILPVK